MAVANAMFLFEVVVESVKSLVESNFLVIRSNFADVFSLELKDPKQMHIVIPEPPPLPPDTGKKKKGKKAKKPKAKKGKKGKIVLPPPEPAIQSGQSVLFTSSAEFLIQTMRKYPLEISLWSKEDDLVFIGSNNIPWDPVFLVYLDKIANFQEPIPITLKDEYNIFEEGTAKLMAKLSIQVKLSHMGDKVTTSFRTLSEDPTVKKYLYTGANSKTTSYICTLKTTDEEFEENCKKIKNSFIKDKPKSTKLVFADYKNAPCANLTFFNEGDYCCLGSADKPPESIYKSPETLPDIDFIVDYIRKVIVSCNDNLRMLTPRPTIRPRIKATDIDRLCYCKETRWPDGKLAQLFKSEAQKTPCPVCVGAEEKAQDALGATFDIANLRGPCGRTDCRIARDLRAYIQNLVEEDKAEININDIFGPCGSKECTLAEKIRKFIRLEGTFADGQAKEGLSTQCDCIQIMKSELNKKKSCDSLCSIDCSNSDSEESTCEGPGCPYSGSQGPQGPQVYNVYYFTVEHDGNPKSTEETPDPCTPTKYKFCASDCPSKKESTEMSCSKTTCSSKTTDQTDKKTNEDEDTKCATPVCPDMNENIPRSPADDDIIIKFDDIHNPCCVKTCDVAEKVKGFIVDSVISKKGKVQEEDPCYCDCVCTFKFTNRTTYCAVCGGYECLGDDMKNQPVYAMPHPCPVYHKLYDKKYIKVKSPWPDDENIQDKKQTDKLSTKSSKTVTSKFAPSRERSEKKLSMKSGNEQRSIKTASDEKDKESKKIKKPKKEKKKIGKFTANVEEPVPSEENEFEVKYPYPSVPYYMGWNWKAKDIPGLKHRPKWKPGAAHKMLVRKYKAIREGLDNLAKKKRAMLGKKKKLEAKPTLIVKKQDGEYTVQMEVFKKYSKERLLFQYPYDEKPPLIYTIGKTEEEKQLIQKQRERRERRETRRKCRFIQSSFRDRCQEICLKAYNQAIGVLPAPNPNSPDCPCHTDPPGNLSPSIPDSCSCSDGETITSSDTDDDDWIIEFTPPAGKWDAKAKHPPVLQDNECQYNYLDYRVKLLDKSGNQVPRFFKGPDGKQQCSDLGGFWSPDHFWLEINKDGYIGPDNRWVPMNFIGPDGMNYSAEDGCFTDSSGRLLKIGIDGYIDKDDKWVWYKKPKGTISKTTVSGVTKTNGKHEIKIEQHGKDEKVKGDMANKNSGPNKSPLSSIKKKGNGIDHVTKSVSYSKHNKNPVVMSVSMNYERNRSGKFSSTDSNYKMNRNLMDKKKLTKYREIMQGLEIYDDLVELKPPIKTNRASNTGPMKGGSSFIKRGFSQRHTRPFLFTNHSSNSTSFQTFS